MHLKQTLVHVLALALSSSVALAAERGPSTPEERAKAVTLVQSLEAEPLGAAAGDARRWLTQWLIEVPDITVNWCADLLAPLAGKKKNHGSEISIQVLYSATAYVIQHPTKAEDRLAVNEAGVEGALRAYESILKVDPKARWPFLDDLLVKRENGQLSEYVVGASKTCDAEQK